MGKNVGTQKNCQNVFVCKARDIINRGICRDIIF